MQCFGHGTSQKRNVANALPQSVICGVSCFWENEKIPAHPGWMCVISAFPATFSVASGCGNLQFLYYFASLGCRVLVFFSVLQRSSQLSVFVCSVSRPDVWFPAVFPTIPAPFSGNRRRFPRSPRRSLSYAVLRVFSSCHLVISSRASGFPSR